MIYCISEIVLPAAALGVLGALAAVLLCVVVKRFAVVEDDRIGMVEELLPGANCGACGLLGCHDFAVECVRRGGPDGIVCPGAGDEKMRQIAGIFGKDGAGTAARNIAVVGCGGAYARRFPAAIYSGPKLCRIESRIGSGPMSCSYGCLGCGDCTSVCPFGAIRIDPASRLPLVDEDRCTGCGKCVEACPRKLISLRPQGPKGRRVWVGCSNRQRGAVARKGCSVACIGCGKCVRTCPFGAVEVRDNLAVIDPTKCRLCRKCVAVCPTGAIKTSNFPASVSDQ